MAKSSLLIGFVASLLFVSLIAYSLPAFAQGPDLIPVRYIVVLEDGVSPQDVTRGNGVVPDFVYNHALNGFSGPLSPVALDKLKQDSRVLYIEQDQKMFVSAQIIPTGIDRIDAEPISSPSSFAGQVTIAIIDTGIDFDHPDLNVLHRADCVQKSPMKQQCDANRGDDGYGHGTHVAGTVAALDNGIGPVGVVPGADLWSIRVLDNDGSGWNAGVIAGVDYVTANAGVIDVANMSLGGSTSAALNTAVTNSIAAGVVYAVAAGNGIDDAKNHSPASTPNAITVSAIADFDGVGGGLNDQTIAFSSCTEDKDDSFACFSNFGSLIDIAAPGVSIFSTYKDGGYATFSGTSMASPHVAGAAAKLIAESASPMSPSQVRTALIDASIKSGEPNYFTGDTDGIAEPLLYVGGISIIDEIAPSISDIVSSTTSDSATITWSTDEPTTSLINYGTTIGYGLSVSDTNYATSHSVELTGLTSLTDYHFMITSADSSNNSASSNDIQFTTTSPPTLVSISISPANPSITEGSTQQFTATGLYSDYTSQVLTIVSWSSSDGVVATIDSSGLASSATVGSTTITAISGGLESTTTLTVTAAPVNPSGVVVSSITYDSTGGKNNDRHLVVTVTLVDDMGSPVSGASVEIGLYRDGSFVDSTTGTTGSTGNAGFTLNNARSGTYTTEIINVVASGLTWDGITPSNTYTK